MVPVIVDGIRAILGYLILFFVPGFLITLVFFPRLTDMRFVERLVWAIVLSIGSSITTLLFMRLVLGVDANTQRVSLGLSLFSAFLLIVWVCEIVYLSSWGSGKFLHLQKHLSRAVNKWRDRTARTALSTVIWHESTPSGGDHIDHSYLIAVKEAIDIQLVDETRWKVSEPSLLPQPNPKTEYFELVIREFNEGDVSLIDDLQIYPVQVLRKPDLTFLGHRIHRGALRITKRLYKKTETSEIQWIYSHDFHLFAILYSEDTLVELVERVLLKLDEIATSIKSGTRVSSHLEDMQKLRAETKTVKEKPRKAPTITKMPARYRGYRHRLFSRPAEIDRRKLQADIVRDLTSNHVTPDTFRTSDRMITSIKIPEKTDTDKLQVSLKEIQNDDWLYE